MEAGVDSVHAREVTWPNPVLNRIAPSMYCVCCLADLATGELDRYAA